MKYRTIVADPPWKLMSGPVSLHAADDGYRRSSRSGLPARVLSYPTLTVEEISALPVDAFAAKQAHLYLWTTNRYLEAAYQVARSWGFSPSPGTVLVWCKAPKGRGLGESFSIATEYCLFVPRGGLRYGERVERNWWQWPRGEHSAKPEAFLDIVERVSPGPYLELFSRRARLGWDVWGDESLQTVELASLVQEDV